MGVVPLKTTAIVLCVCLVAAAATVTLAKNGYLGDMKSRYSIPDGSKLDSCNTCHGGPWPGRNLYGQDLDDAGSGDDLQNAFAVTDTLDSDSDGAKNWVELVNGTWPGDAGDTAPVEKSTWGKVKALYR